MERNDRARTIVYIDVEEFQPTSRCLLPSPMDAFDSGPDPSFRLAPSSPVYNPSSPKMAPTSSHGSFASPEWVPRSTSAENWGPTSPGPVPPSPPYIPRSPESVPTSPVHYYPTSPGPGPQSPAYTPTSPQSVSGGTSPVNYYPTSPGPVPPSPPYMPRFPEAVLGTTSPVNYYPTSPGPVPPSPPYIPRSPESVQGSTSPVNYYPTSPGPGPQSPAYVPQSPGWALRETSPIEEIYYPTSPGPVPPSPPYIPRSPEWASRETSPTEEIYYPTSPGPVPPSPPYVPQSPKWESTTPPPVPLSPSSPATTNPFDELERELYGYGGRGRFVYNRARSIVPEEEEEQRQRGERDASTEPFPELSDRVWEENTDRETEEEVQGVLAHEPVAAVPDAEEELSDCEYYEQLDQEEKGDAGSEVEKDVQVQELVTAFPDESSSQPSNPSAFTCSHHSTPIPWIRSNPFLPAPSASASTSTRQAAPESEDLPTDHEYYEQLNQETAAETLIRIETEGMHSIVDNPYTAIAALNCEPQSNPYASYPSLEIDMHQDAKEHADWACYSSSAFCSPSAIIKPAHRVPQRLMGRVKVQKRIDRMMWNRLMQKKMVQMMEVCEKYAPADVLKELKR